MTRPHSDTTPKTAPATARRRAAKHAPTCAPARRSPPLRLEALEAREVPALTIQFDYSFDTSGLFNDASHRAVLQQAANAITANVGSSLGVISAGYGNTWSASFFNPSTGATQTVNNLSIAADTIVVYVGGRDLTGAEAGVGGFGGWSSSGSAGWNAYVANRGQAGFGEWGGSLAFDTVGTPWNWGASGGVPANAVDFYSVASHELGHILGIGTANNWFAGVSGGTYHGATADAVYGGAVPVYGDSAHWANNLTVGGTRAALDPILPYGTRVPFSTLDFAALKDLGWSVPMFNGAAAPARVSPPVSPPPPVNPPLPPVAVPAAHGPDRVAISGGGGGVVVFGQGAGGQLHQVSPLLDPFPGYTGDIRSAVADFNGDGVQDLAVATAAGAAATVKIYNGRDWSTLVWNTTVLGGFSGGAFLAAGDIRHDGEAQLVVSADAGGSPRITVFNVANGALATMDDFYAFDTPSFRGGARIAVGDLNADGYADLIVTAGPGGGPRVSPYDGKALARGQATRIFNDFFAYDPALRTGAYVAIGDVNGDGYGDIIFSADVGGSSRTIGYSGALLTANPLTDPLTLPFLFSQYATPENLPKGTRVTVKDLDGDGRKELLFTTAALTDSTVRTVTSAQILSAPAPTNVVQKPIGNVLDLHGLYLG